VLSADVVYRFCLQSAHAGIVLPGHGRFVGASSQPFSEYKRRPGDRVGFNWRMLNVQGKRAMQQCDQPAREMLNVAYPGCQVTAGGVRVFEW